METIIVYATFHFLLLFKIIEYFTDKLFENNLFPKIIFLNLSVYLFTDILICYFNWSNYLPPLSVISISNKMCLNLTEINESVHIVFKIFISYLRTKVYAMY